MMIALFYMLIGSTVSFIRLIKGTCDGCYETCIWPVIVAKSMRSRFKDNK